MIGREHCYGLVIAGGVLSVVFLFWKYALPHAPRVKPLEELREELRTAQTPFERADAAAQLGERRDTQSMPALLQAMEDPDPQVRARAGVAVQKILHADFYFRADDPPEKREQALQRIRQHWEAWQAKLAAAPGGTAP